MHRLSVKPLLRKCSLVNYKFPLYQGFISVLTSSLLTSLFLMAFCAAALVAMRRPSAASRSLCCCSSLSGLAAAPCVHTHTDIYIRYSYNSLQGETSFERQAQNQSHELEVHM